MTYLRLALLVIAFFIQYKILHLGKTTGEFWMYVSSTSIVLFVFGTQIVIKNTRSIVVTVIVLTTLLPFATWLACVWVFSNHYFSGVIISAFRSLKNIFLYLLFYSGWLYSLFIWFIWRKVVKKQMSGTEVE